MKYAKLFDNHIYSIGHSMGGVFQTFYTEESAYAKLENLSKSFNYAEWDQQCKGEANHLFVFSQNFYRICQHNYLIKQSLKINQKWRKRKMPSKYFQCMKIKPDSLSCFYCKIENKAAKVLATCLSNGQKNLLSVTSL